MFADERRILLILLCLASCVAPIFSQSMDNPAFWQGPRVYDSYDKGPVDNSTANDIVAISQNFQTLYAANDPPMSAWRILIDYSNSCNASNITLQQLQTLNNDNIARYASINRSVLALVERGGCGWAEKVHIARMLSSSANLTLAAVVISDNETRASVEYDLYSVNKLGRQFTYDSPLPDDRNATHMQDNDLRSTYGDSTPPVAVFFIPKTYGLYLRSLISNSTNILDMPTERRVWQLRIALDAVWAQPSADTNVFTRGYLSYVIALSAILFVAVCGALVFLRWWRVRQRREEREYEARLSAHAENIQMRRKSKPLPVNVVNAIPIAAYSPDTVKNPSCPICLEDYEQDKTEVRILGCGHGFCVLCIDPWLTQKSTLCPICKWNCLPSDTPKLSSETAPEDTEPNQVNDARDTSTRNDSPTTATTTTVTAPISVPTSGNRELVQLPVHQQGEVDTNDDRDSEILKKDEDPGKENRMHQQNDLSAGQASEEQQQSGPSIDQASEGQQQNDASVGQTSKGQQENGANAGQGDEMQHKGDKAVGLTCVNATTPPATTEQGNSNATATTNDAEVQATCHVKGSSP